ncbi:DUF5133 domain-containing protein [Streptomyces sp. 16-176A]
MLMPHPEFLRKLVHEYETALAEEAAAAAAVRTTRAQDLAYTLCVSTGTREVRAALETARRLLAATGAAPAAERRTPAVTTRRSPAATGRRTSAAVERRAPAARETVPPPRTIAPSAPPLSAPAPAATA